VASPLDRLLVFAATTTTAAFVFTVHFVRQQKTGEYERKNYNNSIKSILTSLGPPSNPSPATIDDDDGSPEEEFFDSSHQLAHSWKSQLKYL